MPNLLDESSCLHAGTDTATHSTDHSPQHSTAMTLNSVQLHAQLGMCSPAACSAVSRSLTGHRSNCLTLEFHPFGSFITTGSLDTNVKVWDLRRKDAITTFKGHTRGVVKLAISPDGKWVCSGSENGEIKVRTAEPTVFEHLIRTS